MKIDWGKAAKATIDAAIGAAVVTYAWGFCPMVFAALGIALLFNAARDAAGFDWMAYAAKILPVPVRTFLGRKVNES